MAETDRTETDDQVSVTERIAQNPQELAVWVFNTFNADINTPLTIMGGNADLLEDFNPASSDYRDIVSEMASGAQDSVLKINALQKALQDAVQSKPLKLVEQKDTASGQPEMSIHLPSYHERQPGRNT